VFSIHVDCDTADEFGAAVADPRRGLDLPGVRYTTSTDVTASGRLRMSCGIQQSQSATFNTGAAGVLPVSEIRRRFTGTRGLRFLEVTPRHDLSARFVLHITAYTARAS